MAEHGKFQEHKKLLLYTLERLGWTVNYDKSDLIPGPCQDFIGYKVDSRGEDGHPVVRISATRVRQLHKDIRRVLCQTCVSARVLARICGQCVSMAKAVLPGKLLLRNAYRLLEQRSTWGDLLQLDTATRQDLSWWLEALGPCGWNGLSVPTRPVEAQCETDASDSGWGGYYNGRQAGGFRNGRLRATSINYRELMSVLLTIKTFGSDLQGKHVYKCCLITLRLWLTLTTWEDQVKT